MTNTEQAVALAEKHGAKLLRKSHDEDSIVGFLPVREFAALLADHRQQVIDELAGKAGVMPQAHGKHFFASWEVACDANEVLEAIAAMQALREAAFDKGFLLAASWAGRDDLHHDQGSRAYLEERDAALRGEGETK